MQFGSMLVYCTVYDMCVWGGPTSIFFQGAPNPLATALSVCNNVLLRSRVEFGRLLLLKYAFYSLLYRCKNEHFRCKLHIHLKKIT